MLTRDGWNGNITEGCESCGGRDDHHPWCGFFRPKMSEEHRQKLLAACAFATVFVEGANRELKGADSQQREEATCQLAAALLALDEEANGELKCN